MLSAEALDKLYKRALHYYQPVDVVTYWNKGGTWIRSSTSTSI